MNDSIALHPAALAVANWWAGKAGIVLGNGDHSERGGLTTALAVLAGAQGQTIAPSKREAFVAALARRVSAELARQAERDTDYEPSVTIGVDYSPDPMLADAAQEAGVSGGAFPWKTMTWTYPTHVVTSLGYGGKSVLAWQAEGWEHPTCGTGQYTDESPYGRLPRRCSGLMYHEDDHTFDVPDPLCSAVVEKRGNTEVCNRPANDSDHLVDDGYYGTFSWVHEFQSTASKAVAR